MDFIKYIIVMYAFMMSPGPSAALISRNAAKFGFKGIHFTILGILLSITFFSIIAIVGIGAIIHIYPNAFKTVKIIGSLYILFLGCKIFFSTFKKNKPQDEVKTSSSKNKKAQFFTALATDLANPLSIVGTTSMILGFVNITDSIETKATYFILTLLCAACYCYTYAALFGILLLESLFQKKWIYLKELLA